MTYVNESEQIKKYKKESREMAENQIEKLAVQNPIQRAKLSTIIWNEHLRRIKK